MSIFVDMNDKTITIPAIGTSPKRWGWIIHLITWGMFLGFPFLFIGRETPSISWDRYLHYLIVYCSFVIMFYTNYFYLISRFLFNKRIGWFLLSNAALIVVLMSLVDFIQYCIPFAERGGGPFSDYVPHWTQVMGFFLVLVCGYALIGAVAVAFKMTSNWYTMETERRELERSRSEAELQNLKSQLNPHFLFNTLNNIYSLIAFSPEKAQEAVHELSRMLRYVMHDSNQALVPLQKDLDFVRNYVELMRIRLPQHVELKTEISSLSSQTLIAPLLFISLIENAFKHGVSNNKPSFIHIRVYQEVNRVICSIVNSDFHKDSEQDKSGSGIGLVNLERRLSLLYPGKYAYEHGSEGTTYRSYLVINLTE